MTNARTIAATLVLLAMVGLAWFWYQSGSTTEDTSPNSAATNAGTSDQKSVAATDAAADSPFAVNNGSPGTAIQTQSSDSGTVQSEAQSNDVSDAQSASFQNTETVNPVADYPDLDLSQLGHEPIADAQFDELVERLRSDPSLLQQLIDEFRQETNPRRLAELSRLLGEVGGPDVTLTASELIFSGNAESRLIGLELLQAVQPGNSEARDLVSGLLATEVEPDVLVGTLTALASPGNVDDAARANLSEQVAYLTEHDDASVRAISLNILSRWTTDSRYTAVLIGGLDDPIPTVRESATYALVGHEDASQDVMNSLFSVVSNDQEDEPVRRGAILALRGMELTDMQRSQIAAIEKKLDSRPR